MWKKLLPTIEIRRSTTAAIAAGTGAAIGYALIPWWWIFPAIFFAVLLPRRRLIPFGIWLILCLTCGMIHYHIDNARTAALPRKAKRISGEIVCIDRRTTAVESLKNPTAILCEIHSPDGKFEATVIFPRNHRQVEYGDKFHFDGRYFPAKPTGITFDGDNFTEKIPPLYGDRPLILADKIEPPWERETRFFRPFFICRDALLEILLSDVDDPEVRSMSAKMFFNASAGVPGHLQRHFVNSGTVHLFSVSGLHVTILAGILLLLLRPLPFAWRYRMTALLIVFYVLCTGAPVAAVRAGAMIAVWCFMRSMLYYAPGWNAMMLTWSAFALLSPDTLGSLGAQYSFGITAALIMLMDNLKLWREKDREILELMPPRSPLTDQTRRHFRFKHQFIAYIAVAAVAFAASCGLSVLRQNLFIPGSILTNLLIPLFTPLLFISFVLKLLLGPFLPFINEFAAVLLCAGFYTLTDTVQTFAAWFPPIPTFAPPVWSVILFYLLLFTALSCKHLKIILPCVIAIIAIMCIWPYSKISAPGKIVIINHGANNPAMLIHLPPNSSTASIVDVPDADSGRLAAVMLRRNGYYSADINFSRGVRNCSAGVPALAKQIQCHARLPHGNRKSTGAFNRNLDHPSIDRINAGNDGSVTIPNHNTVVWHIYADLEITSETTAAGRLITVRSGNRTQSVTIPWNSLPTIWEMTL